MLVKQNPFSLYDFLGYFIPGAFLFFLILFVHALTANGFNAHAEILVGIGRVQSDFILPFVLSSYALGHLVGFLSSMTVERYLVLAYGYPSRYLMQKSTKRESLLVQSIRSIRGSNAFGARLLVLWLFLLPISALDGIIGGYMDLARHYVKPMEPFLARLARRKASQLLIDIHGKDILDSSNQEEFKEFVAGVENDDYFRILSHWVHEFSPAHAGKLQNYVSLYGFTRSICLLLVMFFWVCVVVCAAGGSGAAISIASCSCVAFVSFVAFMAFSKFYRRFSVEVFMAVCVAYPGRSQSGIREYH